MIYEWSLSSVYNLDDDFAGSKRHVATRSKQSVTGHITGESSGSIDCCDYDDEPQAKRFKELESKGKNLTSCFLNISTRVVLFPSLFPEVTQHIYCFDLKWYAFIQNSCADTNL